MGGAKPKKQEPKKPPKRRRKEPKRSPKNEQLKTEKEKP